MKSIFKRYLNKELIVPYIIRGSGVLLTFVLNVVLARIYGADLSGEYYVLYNILALIASVIFLGFGYVIVHYITPYYGKNCDSQKGNYLFTSSLYTILVMTLIVGTAVYLFRKQISVYLFGSTDYDSAIQLLILAIFPYLGILLFTELFKALRKPNQSIFAANIIVNIILIALLLCYRRKGIREIYTCFILAHTISVLCLLLLYKGLFKSRGIRVLNPTEMRYLYKENKSILYAYSKENITLSVVAISNILLSVFDTFVISHQLTTTDVALYSVANKVVSFGSIILTTVNSIIGFQIADLAYKNDRKALSRILLKYTQIMIPLGFAYYIFAAVFALVIPFIFGKDYAGSISLCYALALGQFISIITGPCSYFVIMTGHAKKYTEITIIAAIISVISNLLLVPIFGVYGAVISNILTLFYKNVHTFLFAKGTVNLRITDFIRLKGID